MAVAALGAAVGVANAVGGIFGGPDPAKQRQRFQGNLELYNEALGNPGWAGSPEKALQLLLDRSGRGTAGAGLATQDTRDDAWAKYQAARAVQGKTDTAGGGTTPTLAGMGAAFTTGKMPGWVMPVLLLSAGFLVYWYGIRRPGAS